MKRPYTKSHHWSVSWKVALQGFSLLYLEMPEIEPMAFACKTTQVTRSRSTIPTFVWPTFVSKYLHSPIPSVPCFLALFPALFCLCLFNHLGFGLAVGSACPRVLHMQVPCLQPSSHAPQAGLFTSVRSCNLHYWWCWDLALPQFWRATKICMVAFCEKEDITLWLFHYATRSIFFHICCPCAEMPPLAVIACAIRTLILSLHRRDTQTVSPHWMQTVTGVLCYRLTLLHDPPSLH